MPEAVRFGNKWVSQPPFICGHLLTPICFAWQAPKMSFFSLSVLCIGHYWEKSVRFYAENTLYFYSFKNVSLVFRGKESLRSSVGKKNIGFCLHHLPRKSFSLCWPWIISCCFYKITSNLLATYMQHSFFFLNLEYYSVGLAFGSPWGSHRGHFHSDIGMWF